MKKGGEWEEEEEEAENEVSNCKQKGKNMSLKHSKPSLQVHYIGIHYVIYGKRDVIMWLSAINHIMHA